MSKIVDVLTAAFSYATQGATIEEIVPLIQELDKCKVKVWRESKNVKLPTYGKDGDACMDVYVHSIEQKSDGRTVYHTGLHFALPEDYEMEIRPRSSNTKTKAVMQNSPGTLDAGYRGELMIVHRDMEFPNSSYTEHTVGERVAQILIRRRERIAWDEVKSLEDLGFTDRGQGGFGSTGR